MSASVLEQILARVVIALTGATAAGSRIDRNRQDAYGFDEHPAINIKRLPSETSAHSERLHRSLFAFEIDFHVAGADHEAGADALHVAADAVLAADAGLAGLGRGLLCTGTELFGDEADFPAGRLAARYQIHVLTRPGDLTRAII